MLMNLSEIKPDLMVHARGPGSMGGAPGAHVGTVDHLEGTKWIKLKRSDSQDGRHHWMPVDWVVKADADAVYIDKSPEEFARGIVDDNPTLQS
jgi:hypothetical protein